MPNKPKEVAVLTRDDVYHILVNQMGWEPIDVTSFWKVCKYGRYFNENMPRRGIVVQENVGPKHKGVSVSIKLGE